MITLSPPSLTDTRSALGDWLELNVLLSTRAILAQSASQPSSTNEERKNHE